MHTLERDDMSEEVESENLPLSAAVAGGRVLADGTLEIRIHVEPGDRARGLHLLNPGLPLAIMALKPGHAAKNDKPAAATYRDFGPICREAIDLSANPQFHAWRMHCGKLGAYTKEQARALILTTCNVGSRKDLDTAEGARELFIEHIRKPFHAWLARRAGA